MSDRCSPEAAHAIQSPRQAAREGLVIALVALLAVMGVIYLVA